MLKLQREYDERVAALRGDLAKKPSREPEPAAEQHDGRTDEERAAAADEVLAAMASFNNRTPGEMARLLVGMSMEQRAAEVQKFIDYHERERGRGSIIN